MSEFCHPNCIEARNKLKDYDAFQSAALVAVSLISSARVILKLDTEFTEYSPQYLVDNAGRKEEDVQGDMDQQRCGFTLENIHKYLEDNVYNPKKEDGQGEMVLIKIYQGHQIHHLVKRNKRIPDRAYRIALTGSRVPDRTHRIACTTDRDCSNFGRRSHVPRTKATRTADEDRTYCGKVNPKVNTLGKLKNGLE